MKIRCKWNWKTSPIFRIGNTIGKLRVMIMRINFLIRINKNDMAKKRIYVNENQLKKVEALKEKMKYRSNEQVIGYLLRNTRNVEHLENIIRNVHRQTLL